MRRSNYSALRALTTVSALAAFASPGLAQQFQWTAGTIPGTPRWTEGVEAADVDNDGDLDLFFADGDGFSSASTQRLNRLVINQLEIAAGQFNDQSNMRLGGTSNAKMAVAADVDADGWVDCLFANAFNTDLPFLYINRGAAQPGFYDEEGSTRGLTTAYSSASANFGDLDNDGDLDLIICDSGNSFLGGAGDRPHLFFNDGAGNFTENAAALNAPIKAAHMDVQFVDIDNDWDLDFFGPNRASNSGGNHYLMLNDGAGNFTNASSLLPNTSSNVYEAEVGDLDGDTDMDMFFVSLGSFSEGAVRNNFVENGGTLSFTAGGTLGTGDDNEISLLDYDMDGDLDAIVAALGQSSEKMVRNNSGNFALVNGVFENISDSTLDAEVADLDNDGAYDVITGQGESSSGTWENKVYYNGGPVDSLAPIVAREEALVAPTQSGPWVVRAQIRDQVMEDGETYVSAVANYSVDTASGSIGGSVAALDMSGGMFRFAMSDTSGGAGTQLCYSLTFTDYAGNQTTTSQVCVALPGPVCGYTNYGVGAGGANVLGLAGVGTPAVGGSASLDTTGMVSGTAFLSLAIFDASLPILGGTVLVDPGTQVTTFFVGAVGSTASFSTPLPNDPVLGGVALHFQSFEVDAAQSAGIAMSNGVKMTICP
ncbi:FG-GAP repeat domain-containing protein [Engelhardtia mirabilis]|uniref:FG-GAP repeat protein n=1 Tax=Engelhardtia mirabilis TaxID=2528011 RepID=A0A518BQH3_9BACT|nr:FG-GAP repeat protein [Planctomycetes bacterium Pla133]QDV03550.1 FG-GAP repeat protein [Planctomycetes bacterium Pla86]